MKKPGKFRNNANLDRWKAMHGKRTSSAASPHTPAPLKGTRAAKAQRAIKESIQ